MFIHPGDHLNGDLLVLVDLGRCNDSEVQGGRTKWNHCWILVEVPIPFLILATGGIGILFDEDVRVSEILELELHHTFFPGKHVEVSRILQDDRVESFYRDVD